jgi:hypothetical protein
MPTRNEYDADIKQEDSQRLLVETVLRYQVLYRHWMGQYQGDRELLRLELNDCVMDLWLLSQGAMYKLAARWISGRTAMRKHYGRTYADDQGVEALAWSFFLAMIERLPGVVIDPERNVRALLAKVTWFAAYDQHKKEYPKSEPMLYSLEQPVNADSDQPLGDTVADPATIEQYDTIVLQLEFRRVRRLSLITGEASLIRTRSLSCLRVGLKSRSLLLPR